jgi:hypothetical protein
VYVHTDKHEQDLIARIPCDGLLYNFILNLFCSEEKGCVVFNATFNNISAISWRTEERRHVFILCNIFLCVLS